MTSIEDRIARMRARVAERETEPPPPPPESRREARVQCWDQIRKYLPELAREMMSHKDFFDKLQRLEVETPEGKFEYKR